jgi:hypothetical protein
MQYRNGFINSTAAAVTLPLGFVPDKFQIYNLTILEVNPPNSATPGESLWLKSMPNASALLTTYTAGAPVVSYITSNGITPVVLGGDWQNTIYTINSISNANPGVVTVATITPTNSMTLANGMTVTISGAQGMQGVNTNRFIVSNLTIVGGGPTYTFTLYDVFGNPFNTTNLGTYTGTTGELDVISYPPTAPVLNPVNGQVITPGSPAGLQLDIGYEGVILGTGVVGASTNVLFWEAFYATPTGW